VSPDGEKREVFGEGFRSANTIGIGPEDTILTVDQQGDWVPVDRLDIVLDKGGSYGYFPHRKKDLQKGKFNTPVAWLPHTVDNSAGFINYINDKRYGTISNHWVIRYYGQRTVFSVLIQKKRDKTQ